MTEKLLLLYGNQVENGFLEEPLHSPTQRDSNEDLKKESLSTIILVSDEKKDLPESFISQTDKKNKFMKIFSLIIMTILNSTIVLIMRYLRTRKGDMFIATTAVIRFVYTLQNNLFFIVISNLDVATAQVLYQFRIFTTCIFSVVILGKEISRIQALSMITLFAGISLVQLNLSSSNDIYTNSLYVDHLCQI
ncbi:SLC35A1_2_3 [Acanthosepion pharaonis]|uniref:SLC35A1_2_3 n=1 Tax=Acanthosepion pharaonis TaxID=158019 RepID=A0A812CYZ0_ACAPH|nr:SLC35A1_2_3 [Sepia pharaonis]